MPFAHYANCLKSETQNRSDGQSPYEEEKFCCRKQVPHRRRQKVPTPLRIRVTSQNSPFAQYHQTHPKTQALFHYSTNSATNKKSPQNKGVVKIRWACDIIYIAKTFWFRPRLSGHFRFEQITSDQVRTKICSDRGKMFSRTAYVVAIFVWRLSACFFIG